MQKLQAKKLAVAACFVLFGGSLVSCTKSAVAPSDLTASASDALRSDLAARSKKEQLLSTSNLADITLPSISVSPSAKWKTRPDGPYAYTQALADFNNVIYWDQAITSQIVGGKLKTTLLKNSLTPGGVLSKIDVEDGSEYQLQFDMMFDPQFDLSWGGKLGFGFLMGNGNTGGVPATDGNGGSIRLMWYKNTSTSPVILKPYLYYKDQPGTYGDDFGKTFPSNGTSVQKGTWYTVKMYVKSNTGSNTDGWVRFSINGTTLLDQAIRWTTNDAKRLVNSICFETFRGGGETYWQSPTDGSIYFDNVSWTKIKS